MQICTSELPFVNFTIPYKAPNTSMDISLVNGIPSPVHIRKHRRKHWPEQGNPGPAAPCPYPQVEKKQKKAIDVNGSIRSLPTDLNPALFPCRNTLISGVDFALTDSAMDTEILGLVQYQGDESALSMPKRPLCLERQAWYRSGNSHEG